MAPRFRPAGSTTLTVSANQAPLQNLQVELSVSGSATPGTDYDPVNPIVTINAGTTSASVTVNTVGEFSIQPNNYIVVSITPSPAAYTVAAQGSAVITISGSNARPTVTLTSVDHLSAEGPAL